MTTEVTKAIEKAERDLNNLEEQREALFHRAKQLSKQREAVAHAALVAGDKAAKDKLRAINLEDASSGANIASVDAALVVARANLAAAKQAEASAADKAAALQLRDAIAAFVEEGNELDASLEDMAFHANALSDALNKIHQLGAKAPTFEQVRVNGAHCFKSALMKTHWKKEFEFEHIPTHRLQSFRTVVSGWASMLMRDVEQRLGTPAAREAQQSRKRWRKCVYSQNFVSMRSAQ